LPRRAVVLGLDGMSSNILQRLMEHGKAPYIKYLVNRSKVRELYVDLSFTLVSWSSISAGCDPGKHGIFNCLLPQPYGELRLVTRELLERLTVSEIAALNELRAITINVPISCPPYIRKPPRSLRLDSS